MKILSSIGLLLVKVGCAARYDYNSEWSVLSGHQFVTKLTDDDGDFFIRNNKALLLFFYSRTCPHCSRVKPEFALASEKTAIAGSNVKFSAIEFNLYPNLAQKYGVVKVPAVYYFRNGRLQEQFKGKQTSQGFEDYVSKIKA